MRQNISGFSDDLNYICDICDAPASRDQVTHVLWWGMSRRISRLRWLRWLRMMDRGGGGCSDQIQWRYINILRYFNSSRMLSSRQSNIYLEIPKLTFWHFIFRTTCLDLMLKINCPLIRQRTERTSSWSWINKSYNISGFIFSWNSKLV